MSKKKHSSKRAAIASIMQSVYQSLRTDFYCTEEEIHLIDRALAGEAPIDVVDRINDIAAGKAPLKKRPTFHIDMGDGTFQDITLANHPIILLHDYLDEKYDKAFCFLYWHALTDPSPKGFYGSLRFLKKAPFFAEAITQKQEGRTK